MTEEKQVSTMDVRVTLRGREAVRVEGISEPTVQEFVTDIRKKRRSPDGLVMCPFPPGHPDRIVKYFFASEVITIEVTSHPPDLDLTQTVIGG